MDETKKERHLNYGKLVENSATRVEDIGEHVAFTILCAAIAILGEVEYWRSLILDFGQPSYFSRDVMSNRTGLAAPEDVAA